MTGQTTIPAVPTGQVETVGGGGKGGGSDSGRRDSTLKKAMIHAVLFIAALIAALPVLRVLSVSLRPGDRVLERSLKLIPDGANFDSYSHVLTDEHELDYAALLVS